MDYQAVFKRYEYKYLLTREQVAMLKREMEGHMQADKYGNSTICNIYFDTPDYLLIRRSIEKPNYKEKLRLRSYGVCDHNKMVFPELKKKCDGVVYKRRLEMSECDAMSCLCGITPLPDTQIGREIAYCFTRYKGLRPMMFLSYERQAFYGIDDGDFRMTLDKNILWRDYDLSLCKGVYGNRIVEPDQVLLEVKVSASIPLWLIQFLDKNKIYKTSFSKYGRAYTAKLTEKVKQGGLNCA
jgi:hypothetical protein